MYACGPTVYNFAHLGNHRCYVFNDLLRRFLKFKGYELTHVMNITDVDDKTIRDSRAAGESLKSFTDRYLDAFIDDLKTLNIQMPEILPRATEHIDLMIDLISTLLERGHAYKTERGDVYFKINSFEDYGRLVNLDRSKLLENADGRMRSDEYDKDNANDFALWKAYDSEDGDVVWDAPFGRGRPGWHIECSAMSTRYLGQPFDIHTGGVDLRFPHHTNEIAQSECACDSQFVRYWMHNEFLIVNGKKMSKSVGNFFTLRDLLEKNYHPLAIRYELLKTHYRQRLDFREDHMSENLKVLEKFPDFFARLDGVTSSGEGWRPVHERIERFLESFEAGLDNDLNISESLASLFEFMSDINREAGNLSVENVREIREAMVRVDLVLGVMHFQPERDIGEQVESLIREREEARKQKDFARADQIRDDIKKLGVELKDTPNGVTWKKI